MEVKPTIETIKGEGLKTTAEIALAGLGKSKTGARLIERYAFGGEGRIEHPALKTEVAGIEFENPVMVGAGWDKRGRAVNGLYALGFSGVEIGTVPLFGQPGNPRPRLNAFGPNHGVGFNRLGFNSSGSEAVERALERQMPFPCPVGINVGKNKDMPDEQSPWAHAQVVKRLHPYADYLVFNPSSPNTPGLRSLQRRQPLTHHIEAMQSAIRECGTIKPLLVKIAPDITPAELDDILEVSIEKGVAGIIAVNTTVSESIKAKYGKGNETGGLSGNDWEYRRMALRMAAEIYERAGDKLEIIGVGGISKAEDAIERMLAGASLVQVVTSIREHWGKVAAQINRGILDWMQRNHVNNIAEIIGADTKRGAKH